MEKSCLTPHEDVDFTSAQAHEILELLTEILDRQAHWEEQQRTVSASQIEVVGRLDQISARLDSLLGRYDEEPESSDPLSEWEKQKAALLAEHGEPSAIADKPNDNSSVKDETVSNDDSETEEPTEVTPPSHEEQQEVAELRQKLEEKLRQSEIEISVERAKLARMQQELEAHKSEMEDDFQRQKEELESLSKKKKKKVRWNRFLDKDE